MLKESDFILHNFNLQNLTKGSFTWQAPSNIALVKYWGKQEPQIPENTSISFTLNNCYTQTTLSFLKKETLSATIDFEIFFEGEKKEEFKPKITTFFKRIEQYVPFLKAYNFVIKTENSFPHSSGIASSASGMAALALCVMSLEKALNPIITKTYFNKKASFLARLGSGSACRSIAGELVVWGAHKSIKGSSNLYGVEFPEKVHKNFHNFQDTILLVDEGEKQVSSTVGHNLMHNHPFAKQRFLQANNNIDKICEVLKKGDLKGFIAIVESEALSLHAMMLTSQPSFVLMKPNTLKIIDKIKAFRKASGLHLCFTLDAGANVHLLFPNNEKEKVSTFIKQELIEFCQNNRYICDSVGKGAKAM